MLKSELIENLDDISSIIEDENLSDEEKVGEIESILFEDEPEG